MRDIKDLVDNQAESGVISTLMYHPEFILQSDYLKPGFFYNQDNGCIYWAINELYKQGIDNIDALNISTMLASNKAVQHTIDKYNLPSIQEFIDLCGETARDTIEEYTLLAQTVVTLAYRRDMAKATSQIESLCYDHSLSLSDINAKRNSIVNKIDEKYIVSNEVNMFGSVVDDIWYEICARRTDTGLYGLPSKYKLVNKYFTYEPQELVVIQAKYKEGKSAFMLNEVCHKLRSGIPTLVVDTEMADRPYLERMLSHLTGIPVRKIKNGQYTDEEAQTIKETMDWMKRQPFVHIYNPEMTNDELYAVCKILKYKMDLQFVVYDYMKSNATSSSDNYNLLGAKCDFLKNIIAGSLNMSVLSAAQLNRSGEIADSAKINRYLSVGCKWFLKSQEQISKDGLECGNAGLKIYVSRLGEQMPEDDPEAYIDFIFEGNTMTISEAKQHEVLPEFS